MGDVALNKSKGNVMSTLRNLMLGAALAGFAAMPLAAITIGVGTSVALTAVPDVAASTTTTTTNGTTTEGTVAADGTTGHAAATGTGVTSKMNADFQGSTVISADGMTVGKVRIVTDNADGSLLVWVDLDPTIKAKAHTFTLNIAADSQADGSLLLGWTQADLVAALDAQIAG